jgi:hypothetical protein
MRFSKTTLALMMAGLLAMLGGSVLADIPPGPRPRPPQPLPEPKPDPAPAPPAGPALLIQPTPGAKDATLRIPRKLLPPGDAPKAKADGTGFSPTQTVVAGLAMTAAVSLLGLHLVRRRGRTLAMSVAGATAIIGVGGSILLANAAPLPRNLRPIPAAENKAEAAQLGLRKIPLKIEVVDQGEEVVLMVDPAMLEAGAIAKPVVNPNLPPPPPG